MNSKIIEINEEQVKEHLEEFVRETVEKTLNAMLDDILSFADIGEFVYQPVKTYSNGMYVRLVGF